MLRFATLGIALLALQACASPSADGGEEASSIVGGPVAAPPGQTLSVHTTLGIPEAATATDPDHVLIVKPEYVTSFDSTKKNPRWTSWELTAAWLGDAPRSPDFVPDHAITFAQASNADYTGSGYDRGHICPSRDRSDSVADNESTFVFTNAVPQTAESNTGTWETLEFEERYLAKTHHLFIVAGSIYEGDAKTIGAGVAVPSSMFKIVVVLDGAAPTAADVSATTPVISVEIPNTHTVSGDYRGYRTSISALEAKTGLRFLSDVAPAVHDALASKVDTE